MRCGRPVAARSGGPSYRTRAGGDGAGKEKGGPEGRLEEVAGRSLTYLVAEQSKHVLRR